jgi:ubiquinone/menaquinone biosynthesis C-methylase UbiE
MDAYDVRPTYDAWSTIYDETPNPLSAIEEIVVRSLLRTIEFSRVLDAATGTGRYAIYLAGQGKQVTAIDDNENMLAVAQRKAHARQLAIEFRQENVSNLSFADSSFDLVLCALALAHVEDLGGPCRELVRVLRPGGHLIISDLHPEIQAMMGPDHKELIQGEERLFPAHHSHVEDYTHAVQSAGAEVLVAIDVPMETQRGVAPGALVIWARKAIRRKRVTRAAPRPAARRS